MSALQMRKRSYNDANLKQYWMPDSMSKDCYDCSEKFTMRDLRVCTHCGKVVRSYLKSGALSGLQSIHGDLSVKFGGPLSPGVDDTKESQARRKTSVGYQEEKFAATRVQAVALGQAMMDSGYIEGVETEEFTDGGHHLYRLAVCVDTHSEEINGTDSLL